MNATITLHAPSIGTRAANRPLRRLRGVAVASAALLALSACSESSADAPAVAATEAGGASGDAAPGVAASVVKIDAMEGQAMMASLGAGLTVIDVRTPEEFAAGHVDGAINIDVEGGGFSAAISSLDPAAPYIVYCRSGRRSAIAADAMIAAGFTEVHDMGAIDGWVAAGLPVVTG